MTAAALTCAVLAALLSLWITGPGRAIHASEGHSMHISQSTQLVSDSATTRTSRVNGIVDPYFANSRQGVALKRSCVLSATADTTCTLAIVHTDNKGATWNDVGRQLRITYPESRASYPFVAFATNGKDGWIFGTETFVTHDGGATLTKDSLAGLVSNLSVSGREVWALARPCPPSQSGCSSRLYSAPVGGGPWHLVAAAPQLTYPYLILLRPSPTLAYLAAQSTSASLLVTTNGGSSWVRKTLPPLCGALLHLSADTHGALWALCSSATPTDSQVKKLYRSGDSGTHWTLVSTTEPRGRRSGSLPSLGTVTSFATVGPGDLVIVLDHDPVLVSHDTGMRWFESDLAGANVLGISFSSPRSGWAVTISGELYRTSDGGRHWTVVREGRRQKTR